MNVEYKSGRRLPVLFRDLACMAAILIVGGVLGTAVNWKLVRGAWAGEYALETESATAAVAGIQPISLAEVRTLVEQRKGLLVDARREFFYTKEHIADALALPLVQVEERLADFQRQVTKDRQLITYCSGYGCEDSHTLALRLQQAGYRRIRIFSGGLPEWKQAGLPTRGTDVSGK